MSNLRQHRPAQSYKRVRPSRSMWMARNRPVRVRDWVYCTTPSHDRVIEVARHFVWPNATGGAINGLSQSAELGVYLRRQSTCPWELTASAAPSLCFTSPSDSLPMRFACHRALIRLSTDTAGSERVLCGPRAYLIRPMTPHIRVPAMTRRRRKRCRRTSSHQTRSRDCPALAVATQCRSSRSPTAAIMEGQYTFLSGRFFAPIDGRLP